MITCADRHVLAMTLRFPLNGRRTATVVYAAPEQDDDGNDPLPPAGAVSVKDSLGESGEDESEGLTPTEVKCTVSRSGLQSGRMSALLYGGAGLDAELESKSYTGAKVKDVLADVLGSASIALAASSDKTLLGVTLPFWTRAAGTGTEALRILAEDTAVNANWRILDDGSLWFGAESWPKLDDFDVTELDSDGAAGTRTFAVSDIRVRPGFTWRGMKVERVEFTLGEESLRALVYYGV